MTPSSSSIRAFPYRREVRPPNMEGLGEFIDREFEKIENALEKLQNTMNQYAFEKTGDPAKITVSATSQSVAIPTEPGKQSVRVANLGTAIVWVDFRAGGGAAITALTGMAVPPGGVELFSLTGVSSTDLHAYAIAAGATGDIQFTVGVGI